MLTSHRNPVKFAFGLGIRGMRVDVFAAGFPGVGTGDSIGALIVRIWFRGPLYYNCIKEHLRP